MAPKPRPDRGGEKKAEKNVLGECSKRSLGPLRGEKGNGRRPAGYQAGGQRSIGNYSR